jgi:hypothetical protein
MPCFLSTARLGLLCSALALCLPGHAADAASPGWTSLFNGKDLQGWTTWVSMQPPAKGVEKPVTVRGLNNDPLHVFSVVDGMLRVSGEEWGAVTSQGEFDRFHLTFEFKWGMAKFPPRLGSPRDSGVLYYAVGPQGAQSGHWMRSHEFQLQEGDCGDYHSLDGVTVDAHVGDANEGDWKFFRYDPALPLRTGIAARILKRGNFEKPSGEWNTMEIIADGKTLIHIVNGHEVLRVENSRQTVDGKAVPLARGKLQIQSEGAEAFFRNMRVKRLTVAATQEQY